MSLLFEDFVTVLSIVDNPLFRDVSLKADDPVLDVALLRVDGPIWGAAAGPVVTSSPVVSSEKETLCCLAGDFFGEGGPPGIKGGTGVLRTSASSWGLSTAYLWRGQNEQIREKNGNCQQN